MPTMVKPTDIRDVQVSNLQAIDRPVGDRNLSSFLTELLPQVSGAIKQHQDNNFMHNMSQGINDEMYGVERNVNWLERQAYDQGRESQKVTATRAANKKAYFDKINSMISSGATDEELAAVQKEYLAQSSDVINDSGLTPAVKALQYDSNIKDNAEYLKQTTEKMVYAKQTRFLTERNTRAASTIERILVAESGADLASKLEQHRTDAYAAYVSAYPDKDPSEVNTEIQRELEGLFSFAASGAGIHTDKLTASFSNNLREAGLIAVQNGWITPTTGIEMLATSGKLDSQVMSRNETNFDIEFNNLVNNVVSGQTVYDHGAIEGILARASQAAQSGEISYDSYARLGAKINSFTEAQVDKINNKKLTALEVLDLGIGKTEAMASYDISSDQYDAAVKRQVLSGLNTQDPFTQGGALIKRAIDGDANGEYLPSVMQEGVRLMSSQIMRFMTLDANSASKHADYGTSQKQFEALKGQFNALDKSGSPLAMDLLAPFGDKSQYVADIFRKGGGIHDAQNAIADPAKYAQRQENLKQARNGINTVTVRSWLGINSRGGIGGGIGKGMSDAGEAAWFNALQVAIDQNPKIAGQMKVNSPEALMDILSTDGTLMRDPTNHSAYFMTPRANNRFKTPYKGVDLTVTEIPEVLSTMRASVAKDHHIDPSDVMVQADPTGQWVSFTPIGANGVSLVKTGEGALIRTTDDIYRRGVAIHDKKRKQRELDTTAYDKIPYGLDGAINKNIEKFTIAKGAVIGQGVVGTGNNRHSIKIPATYTVPFNGNITLGTALHNMLNAHEGFIMRLQTVKGHGTDNDGRIVGNGINLSAYEKKGSKLTASERGFYSKALAAQGNPQKLMELQGHYIQSRMRTQQAELAPYGVPVATKANYPKKYEAIQLLAADLAWHSGNYNGIKRVLKHKDYPSALAALRKTKEYTGAGKSRNAQREAMLRQYYTGK